MDMQALATVAAVAQAVTHLKSRQYVPALALITVLLLTAVIVFGPRDRDPNHRD